MKHFFYLLFFCSYTVFSQAPIPQFPCRVELYHFTNNYGIDFHKENWWEGIPDSVNAEQMKYGVSLPDGKEILPPVYDHIFIPVDLKDSCAVQIPFALISVNNEQFVVNLETGEKTKTHSSIIYDDKMFFYNDGQRWGVYNLDFEFLVKDCPGIGAANQNPMNPVNFTSYVTRVIDYYPNQYEFTLVNKQRLLAEGKWIEVPKVVSYASQNEEPTTEKELKELEKWVAKHPDKEWYTPKFGLVELNSGKKIKAQFDRIEVRLYGTEFYYWCTTFRANYPKRPKVTKRKSYQLDIYDQHLKKVFHSENNETPFFNMETYIPTSAENMELYDQLYNKRSKKNVYFLKDEQNKYGAINASGKTVVPFVYDSIRTRYSESHLYKCWKGGQFQWLTNEGVQLPKGGEANSFVDQENVVRYIMKKDTTANSCYLVDSDNVTEYGPFSKIYLPGTSEGVLKKEFVESNKMLILAEREGKMFVFLDKHFQLFDSTKFNANTHNLLLNQMIIEKDATILVRWKDMISICKETCYVAYDRFKHIGFIASLDYEKVLDLTNIQFISDDNPERIIVLFDDRSIRYFDAVQWKWSGK